MKLNFAERVTLEGLLPREGDITTIRIIGDLRRALAASDEEVKQYNVKSVSQADGHSIITWNPDFVSDVEVGDTAKQVIKDALTKLNDEKKLTPELVSLYEAFVEGKEDLLGQLIPTTTPTPPEEITSAPSEEGEQG